MTRLRANTPCPHRVAVPLPACEVGAVPATGAARIRAAQPGQEEARAGTPRHLTAPALLLADHEFLIAIIDLTAPIIRSSRNVEEGK